MILQSSPEWASERLGCVTASRVADVIAKSRDKKTWGASRANYAAELIVERLTGQVTEGYKSAAMERGSEVEAEARLAYEFRRNVDVAPAALIRHPKIEWAAATPDGFVGEDGLIEIKSPNTSTHLETILGKKPQARYMTQMQWQLCVTGRKWCDFVSYDPRLPERMRFFLQRVPADQAVMCSLEKEVEIFLSEVDDTIKRLEHGD